MVQKKKKSKSKRTTELEKWADKLISDKAWIRQQNRYLSQENKPRRSFN